MILCIIVHLHVFGMCDSCDSGAVYDLDIVISLPDSNYNHDSDKVGMFQVYCDVLSADGRIAYR